MNKKTIIILLIVIAIGLVFYIGMDKMNEEDLENNDVPDINIEDEMGNNQIEENDIKEIQYAEVGERAPDFTLKNLDGEKVSLSDYKGKIVFLNFWATWCPYCVKEMPDLDRIYRENEDNDFVVLAVSVGEPKSDVSDFIKDKEYSFPILLDTKGEIAIKYFVRGIPTTYVIDKDGNIRTFRMTMLAYPEMKELLDNARE